MQTASAMAVNRIGFCGTRSHRQAAYAPVLQSDFVYDDKGCGRGLAQDPGKQIGCAFDQFCLLFGCRTDAVWAAFFCQLDIDVGHSRTPVVELQILPCSGCFGVGIKIFENSSLMIISDSTQQSESPGGRP